MSTYSIELVRTIAAPVEEVYAAWTVPDLMGHWMAQKVAADVRVGGRYRNEIDAGEARYIHQGEYRVLEPDARIIQTFQAGEGPSEEYRDEELEILFHPTGDGRTELTLIDRWTGQDLSPEDRTAVTAAWSDWLGGLEKLFER